MSEQEIFEKVQAIVVDNLGVEKDQVTPAANFANDLGCRLTRYGRTSYGPRVSIQH